MATVSTASPVSAARTNAPTSRSVTTLRNCVASTRHRDTGTPAGIAFGPDWASLAAASVVLRPAADAWRVFRTEPGGMACHGCAGVSEDDGAVTSITL